ncbi:MAG: AIR synthase family protein [Candidatus Thorarchaeota archaeon]
MLPGKVPPDVLSKAVFAHLGKKDDSLILGPGLGEDASLIRVGDSIIVAATDPITGSMEDIGWLSVHINANDIATFGVQPRWFLASILLPVGSSESELERIMLQIDKASQFLGITVAGGHTEVTESVDKPIVAGFMIGLTSEGRYVTSSGAQPGDHIVITKSVALEGTAILAVEGASYLSHRISRNLLDEAQKMRDQISVVKDGVVAFGTGHITAMHDPTEGGFSGGIHEICDASRVGFEIDVKAIPVEESTRTICRELSVNELELISSGCMLMTCNPQGSESVVTSLEEAGIKATIVGKITPRIEDRYAIRDATRSPLPRPSTDALWAALRKVSQT